MKSRDANTLNMLISVRQYGRTRADRIPANTAAPELFAAADKALTDMQQHSAAQAQHTRAAREKTTHKNAGLDTLCEMMETFRRTALTMGEGKSGMSEKFRLPKTKRAQDWLAAARGFINEAESLKDEFIKRGIAPTFFDAFRAQIQEVEKSMDDRAQKAAAQVLDTVKVAEAAEHGRRIVRELDAVMRNILAGDHAALAEWALDFHIERTSRSTKMLSPDHEKGPAVGI
jgi:hypothetical protein